MLAWLIKSFLAVSSRMPLVNKQMACQNQIKVFAVFWFAQIFAQNLHKLKTWEKPPIKAKYLVTLRDQSVYSHGIKSSLCPLIGNCLGRSLTCCMLKLQFILWREAQKVTQFFELTTSMTKTAREWHKKIHLREAESKTWEQWIYITSRTILATQKTLSIKLR